MPPATNCGATTDARNPKVVTATGLGAWVTGAPTGTAVERAATGTGAPTGTATERAATGTGAPGRPKSCQALTSTQMAVTTMRIQATGSRTRRTLSHACAVSAGPSSPS